MTTFGEFADQLIASMGGNDAARLGIIAQAVQEGTAAANNPLATTEPMEGATDLPGNPDGVKEYLTIADGIEATKTTLQNGRYPAAVAAIMAGDSDAYCQGIANSVWGTWEGNGDLARAVLNTVRSTPSDGDRVIPTESAPPPPPPDNPPPVEPTPAPAPPENDVNIPTIQTGARGGTVLSAQVLLNAKHSANIGQDGIFGAATEGAVRSFQAYRGIGVDGIVGPITWGVLVNE